MSKKMRVVPGLVACTVLGLFLLNCGSSSSRPAGVLFVVTQGTNAVGSYSIDLNSGNISLINTSSSTCSASSCGFPTTLLLDPTSAVAFVLNQGTFNPGPPPTGVVPSVYGYTVNTNGSLSGAGDLTTSLNAFTQLDMAVAMARDAAGKYLFVVTQGNQSVQPNVPPQLVVFGTTPGSTSLSLVGQKTLTRVPTGIAAVTFTVPNSNPSTSETLLYITSNQDLVGTNDNTVSEYSVDESSGTVTEMVGSPYTTASNPSAVLAVSTTPVGGSGGVFVYVTNVTTNNLNVYQVCTVVNGTCTQQDVNLATLISVGSPVSAGTDPVALVADPTQNFLFVVNRGSNSVSGFRINQSAGSLSGLSPASMPTGNNPVALAIHSSGKFLYVSNNASNDISGFTVDTTSGSLGNPIAVNSAAQPYGLVAR